MSPASKGYGRRASSQLPMEKSYFAQIHCYNGDVLAPVPLSTYDKTLAEKCARRFFDDPQTKSVQIGYVAWELKLERRE